MIDAQFLAVLRANLDCSNIRTHEGLRFESKLANGAIESMAIEAETLHADDGESCPMYRSRAIDRHGHLLSESGDCHSPIDSLFELCEALKDLGFAKD